jgi:hypothetical protein
MTKAIQAAILMFALALGAQAGDGIIQNGSPAASPTPPPPYTMRDEPETESPADGIIQNDLAAPASQAALDVLQSFLTLF